MSFSGPGFTPGLNVTFSCHVPLVSPNLGQFLSGFFFFFFPLSLSFILNDCDPLEEYRTQVSLLVEGLLSAISSY